MRRTLAILCTAAPFVAAGVAALSARHDLRMAWMALVVTLVAHSVAATTATLRRTSSAGISLTIGTFAASAVALIAGARAPFGIIAVAFVLAVFATAGVWLRVRHTAPATHIPKRQSNER
jgi:ABC-type uncharacterized transport system permease subunit